MNRPTSLDPAPRRRPRIARWLAWLALAPLACLANDGGFDVYAECRDGIAHGAYRVEGRQGKLRIEGRYADGLRDGEFVFYSAAGAKAIALPYSSDLIDGTVRAWHVSGAEPGTQSELKLESDISAGFIEGRYRTWYENGNRRSDFVVEEGEIVSAQTWNPDGSVLDIGNPSDLLQTDIEADFTYYARLEQVMEAFPPACESP